MMHLMAAFFTALGGGYLVDLLPLLSLLLSILAPPLLLCKNWLLFRQDQEEGLIPAGIGGSDNPTGTSTNHITLSSYLILH